MDEKKRIDVALFERGLTMSRERAQSLIVSGLVQVNGRIVLKSSEKVGDADRIDVLGQDHPYVSRGGLKLEAAIERFGVNVSDSVCIDVGASTGGFTDVLLRHGAKHVYAVDVGTGQLADAIARDPRVTSMEHTNARTLVPEMFPVVPTLAVMDVSFISIELILPALKALMGIDGHLVSLIKPQFECGVKGLGKKGIVTDPNVRRTVLTRIAENAPMYGWCLHGLCVSPITGTSGNIEFLGDFLPLEQCDASVTADQIKAVSQARQTVLRT